jgi:hypothetical protein
MGYDNPTMDEGIASEPSPRVAAAAAGQSL